MNEHETISREDWQRIERLVNGECGDDDVRSLEAMLRGNPAAQKLMLDYCQLHLDLGMEIGLEASSDTVIEQVVQAAKPNATKEGSHGMLARLATLAASLQVPLLWLSVGGLLVIGGGFLGWRLRGEQTQNTGVAAEGNQVRWATLVNVTNCRWDQTRSTADLKSGGALRGGESLHLLEGMAEINSTLPDGGMAMLHLEGPLAMTLTSRGMPSLLYGNLTGRFACDYEQFTIDTPLGRVVVSGDASIGMIAAANKVELHVFSGSATLELWAVDFAVTAQELTATAGKSLRANVSAKGGVVVDRGEAKESWFLTPAALAASQLQITSEYVETIRSTQPVAYWRFEEDTEGMIRNEMGDRYGLRAVGNAVRFNSRPDGGTAEFGVTAGPGYLLSDDLLETGLADHYSIELWAKPTYCHHGTLFSLLAWTAPQSALATQRVVVEFSGPSSWAKPKHTLDSYPGRLRYVQACTPLPDVQCFSSEPYALRKWQHVVAVKNPKEMQLYLDGQLVDTRAAVGALPSGLRILVGQHLPINESTNGYLGSRLFIGEMDEVAIYDRPLEKEEVRQHFELVRPVSLEGAERR